MHQPEEQFIVFIQTTPHSYSPAIAEVTCNWVYYFMLNQWPIKVCVFNSH